MYLYVPIVHDEKGKFIHHRMWQVVSNLRVSPGKRCIHEPFNFSILACFFQTLQLNRCPLELFCQEVTSRQVGAKALKLGCLGSGLTLLVFFHCNYTVFPLSRFPLVLHLKDQFLPPCSLKSIVSRTHSFYFI